MSGPPINQVNGGGSASYRFMRYPPQRQPLQLLYPGRYMDSQMHFTRDNIPNEDPEGLALAKSRERDFQRAAAIESEALSRRLGGKNKILRHPAIMPEAVIEDPGLAKVTIRDIPKTDLSLEPNQFSLAKAGEAVAELIHNATGSAVNLPLVKENFQADTNIDRLRKTISKKNTKDALDYFTESDGPGIIFFVMIAVITLIIISLIVYGAYSRTRD